MVNNELDSEPSKLPALSVVRMLWKRRWLALSLWAVISVIAIVVVRALPSVYRAEAIVLVDSQKIPENFVSSTVSGDVADRLALISQSIMTSERLLKIIDTFNLYKDERRHLSQEEILNKMRKDISVHFEKSWTGDRMHAFRLGYQGFNPRVVTDVTNRLAGLYVAENVRAREDQAQGTVDFLKRQLQTAKTSLDDQEQRVARFKQEHNGSLPEQQSSLLGNLSSLTVELQGVQAAIDRAQESKLSLGASLSAAESSQASLKASLRGSSTSGGFLKPRSEILAEQLRQLRQKYTPEHPDVQSAEMALAQARREEAEEYNTAKTPGTSPDPPAIEDRPAAPELIQVKERIATIQAQIEVAGHQIETLEERRKELLASIADCKANIAKLPLIEQEMTGLKRNYEESAANYNSLLQKKLAAGVATDMERSQQSERFTIIDPARVPQKPEKPKRPLLAGLGSFGGLVIGLLVGFALEFRKQTLLGEWELPAGTVVLGRVPVIHLQTSAGSLTRKTSAAMLCCALLLHATLFVLSGGLICT
jgi:polysaccharide chain length determinant protein (PEP-CTERM system associated)